MHRQGLEAADRGRKQGNPPAWLRGIGPGRRASCGGRERVVDASY